MQINYQNTQPCIKKNQINSFIFHCFWAIKFWQAGKMYSFIQVCHITNDDHHLTDFPHVPGLILGLRPANERWRYFVTSLIGWAQT